MVDRGSPGVERLYTSTAPFLSTIDHRLSTRHSVSRIGIQSPIGGRLVVNLATASRLKVAIPSEGIPLINETLDDATPLEERIILELRLASGLPVELLDPPGRREVAGLIAEGLVDGPQAFRGRLVLTPAGRLLADAVVRRLMP